MSYTITISRSAEKELQRISPPWQGKISTHIDALSEQPRPSGCKKLVGSVNLWRIRIADYRVVYAIDDVVRVIAIERVAHRSNVYD